LNLLLPNDEASALHPAIVLLDINMPRMGGLELLKRLRGSLRTRSLPVIMLTTSTEDCDIIQSYDSGANSYVPKPVTSDQFLKAAKALGVYWLDLNLQASPLSPAKDPGAPNPVPS
jgi:two-component system response regulator